MPLVPAICPNCGGQLEVDSGKEATVCTFCGTPFIVEKAINNYHTVNNISADTVNIINKPNEFEIWEGVLEKYKGDSLNVVIPDGVVTIADNVFAASKVKRVIIPEGVEKIGMKAFANCVELTEISVPDSVTDIGNYAFDGCDKLSEITIPNKVKKIGDMVFHGCRHLVNINIPDSVNSIGVYAFFCCSSLTNILIGSGTTSIDKYAFSGCRNLKSISVSENNQNYASQDGILYNKEKTKLIFVPNAISGAIAIPDGVTSIDDYVFNYHLNLTSVNIPNSIKSIGEKAFSSCSSLKNIDIPDSVKSIGSQAFAYCSNLKNINMPTFLNRIGEYIFVGTPLVEQFKALKRCCNCGGEFKGFFTKTCSRCGKPKDY